MSRRRRRAKGQTGRQVRLDRIVPRSLQSEHTHPKCYAAPLGGCSAILSDEHFVSFALLEKLCKDPRGIFVRGLGGDPSGKWIQPERAASRVLCTNHNSALESLDAFASALGDELTRTTETILSRGAVSTVVAFDGNNLEAWMLKALCGLVASGQATRSNGERLPATVQDTWLRWLFGDAELLPPLGMYVAGELERQERIDGSVAIGPLSDRDGTIVGLMFSFQWLRATLMLVNWQGTNEEVIMPSSIRRPEHIALHNDLADHRIEFRWNHTAGPGVEMNHVPSPV
jgi:hypothetical protein